MGHGAISIFSKTMASGGTLTGEIDVGRAWGSVYLEVPTMNSNSQLHIQCAVSTGGTYRKMYHPAPNSSVTSPYSFGIPSSVTGAMFPIPNGQRYYKVESTATIDNGCVFKLICSDE